MRTYRNKQIIECRNTSLVDKIDKLVDKSKSNMNLKIDILNLVTWEAENYIDLKPLSSKLFGFKP